MLMEQTIKKVLVDQIKKTFGFGLTAESLSFDRPPDTKLGDLAFSCFDLAKQLKKNPAVVAEELTKDFSDHPYLEQVKNFGPYINFFVSQKYLSDNLFAMTRDKTFGQSALGQGQKILLEFSGPNTNKPQHIGHLRNNVLGQSLVNIFKHCGYKVIPVNIINDRGIHIVKSMLAWMEFGQGETPASSGIKGDHLVGKYYVRFGQELAKEKEKYFTDNKINLVKLSNLEQKEVAEKFLAQSQWMAKARALLLRWEQDNKEVKKLWKTMNSWVYDGYKVTYDRLGIKFDKNYYESETYLLGKDLIAAGLDKKIFFKKDDGSVWVDLKDEGLEEKLLLRSDGTSVYMTQDLGTAKERYEEYKFDRAIYVVASEQERHFKVLFATLKKLGFAWAEKLYHLSYGMMSLPSGKIKSREGVTADADDLMDRVHQKAKEVMAAAEKQITTNAQEEENIAEIVGLGALKFFMLGTTPQKNIIFKPSESISFDGYTGPFIQYTHARINNLLKKYGKKITAKLKSDEKFNTEEKELITTLLDFPEIIKKSALDYNPAVLCQYLFNLAKTFNNFYQNHSVLSAETEDLKKMRLLLSAQTKKVLFDGLALLAINAPEVM
ncbi:MAG: arginine--tRNA ligase [Parcubacteria group bacterium]|nr:MAG: arginine--tRNA ligase [Parcubacteria group bacterium]